MSPFGRSEQPCAPSSSAAWASHCVSIYDARAGGAPHDIDALRAAVADEAHRIRLAYQYDPQLAVSG